MIIFRTDSSSTLGSGHVMRCLTLANELKKAGKQSLFMCRDLPNHISEKIRERYPVILLPAVAESICANLNSDFWRQDAAEMIAYLNDMKEDVEWLIVDHYYLDYRWEQAMAAAVTKVMVIDDLGNRKHDCAILLDQTYGVTEKKYQGLLINSSVTLYGTQYTLLSSYFSIAREKVIGKTITDSWPKKIHVFFGGFDQPNYTYRFSKLLLDHFKDISLVALVGDRYEPVEQLRRLSNLFGGRFDWRQNINNVAEHMAGCDVAIGAPGTATWERACLGLPAAYFAITPNQQPLLEELSRLEFCEFMGLIQNSSDSSFLNQFKKFILDTTKLKKMRQQNLKAIDGQGCIRVVEILLREGVRR